MKLWKHKELMIDNNYDKVHGVKVFKLLVIVVVFLFYSIRLIE